MDVGHDHDPAALAVLQSTELRPGSHRPVWDVLEVGNIKLRTPFQELAALAVDLALEFRIAGYPVVLTLDATGLGGPVVEMARTRAPDLQVIAVTISGGRTLTHNAPDEYTVGKHRLTEVLQVALEQQGLLVPDTPGGELFTSQAQRFVRKPTAGGHQKHEAAGSGHDDLVLAVELALWIGDTFFDQQAGVPI